MQPNFTKLTCLASWETFRRVADCMSPGVRGAKGHAQMNTDHTAGPWRNPKGSVTVISEQVGKKVCDMSWSITGAPQAYANARLIAAAPDLLEALRGAVKALKDEWSDSLSRGVICTVDLDNKRAIERMEAAIAKATGGE